MSNTAVIVQSSGPELPALVGRAAKPASLRFLEFFTVAIRNKKTRKAYARAAAGFLHWCEAKGIDRLQDVQPVHSLAISSSWAARCLRLRSSSISPASARCSIGWSRAWRRQPTRRMLSGGRVIPPAKGQRRCSRPRKPPRC